MKYLTASILTLGFLSACGEGEPFFDDGSGGGGGGEVGEEVTSDDIPAVLAQNLRAASFDGTAETLTVELDALDASPFNASYTRNAALDVNGYQAYEVQETVLQRHFIALFKESPRGNLMAGVVADGGQFGRYWGGGVFTQIDVYSPPTAGGLASYLGSYAGVTNFGGGSAPGRTSGDVWLNVDFTNNFINGQVDNRILVNDGSALEDIFLLADDINTDGSFFGDVAFTDLVGIGKYGGTFGGTSASDVAGILVFNPIRGDDLSVEHGVFINAQCGTAGDDAGCP